MLMTLHARGSFCALEPPVIVTSVLCTACHYYVCTALMKTAAQQSKL